MLLNDKIAIVTGGGVGIGNAIALRYAKEGAHVVVAEINEATGQQTVAEVSAHDRRGLFVKTDMSNLSSINAMVAKTVGAFGRIDILMNNAGVNKQLNFFEVTERDWDWIHSINAKGTVFRQRLSRHLEHRVCGLQGSRHHHDPHRRLAARPLQHQRQRYLSWRYTLGDV
jgi:NAD(P)-dependent dehydrogenase (short-subunit alcohol dehydrogenase family)